MEGFKPILDDMERALGAIDEPSESSELVIDLVSGEKVYADAVGVDSLKNGGGAVCCYFSWREVDEETVQELAEENGVAPEVIKEEVDVGEPFIMQDGIIPLENVSNIRVDTGGLL